MRITFKFALNVVKFDMTANGHLVRFTGVNDLKIKSYQMHFPPPDDSDLEFRLNAVILFGKVKDPIVTWQADRPLPLDIWQELLRVHFAAIRPVIIGVASLYLREGAEGFVIMTDDQIIEGRKARDDGVPEFLNPYGNDEDKIIKNAWWRGWHKRDHELFMENPEEVRKANIIMGLVADHVERDDLIERGKRISRIDSEQGFPAELSFTHFEENFNLTAAEKAVMIFWYTVENFQHKRNSGTTWKRLQQIQLINRDIVTKVFETGLFSSVYHILI